MRLAFFVAAAGAIVIAAACGGATAADCPTQLGRGVACTTSGATCPYTLVTISCDGTSSSQSRSCTCNGTSWDCPEVGPPSCFDAGTCKNGDTKPAGDGCNTCTCMNGTWGCTLMACGDGGTASDPGNVTCAGGPCSVPGNYCCDTPTLDGGVQKCVPGTTSSCSGLRRACDEAADCAGVTGTKVCCIPPNASQLVAYNAQCVLSCKGDPFAYQLCKTSAECENGQPCVTQTCNGYSISTCGPIPPNRCK